jgi:murein DD-endopeptidase MepM/ murein hydrolase activator NlpD
MKRVFHFITDTFLTMQKNKTGFFLFSAFISLVVLAIFFQRSPVDVERNLVTAPVTPDVVQGENGASTVDPAPSVATDTAADPASIVVRHISGTLQKGETLSKAFSRTQVPAKVKALVIEQLGNHVDFRRLRPGNQFELSLDENDGLLHCFFQTDLLNTYSLAKTADGYTVTMQEIPLECRTVTISGHINSSLFASFKDLDERGKLLYTFADIFASKMDFNTETRKGDRFTLTFEKYFKEGQFIRYGNIIYAAYRRQRDEQPLEAFYYSSDITPGAFFDREGRELGTSFLRSPVPLARVSSGFTKRRLHPILGYARPHLGVDLAAPKGTPILAAGDSRVAFIGRNGGYGNQIILDHGNGYRTHYGHLSGFKKGLHKGSRIAKKSVIGYVGSTGLSTGPHVCYRFEENGVFKNPFAMKFKPQSELEGTEYAAFQQWVTGLAPLGEPFTEPRVVKVRHVTFSPDNPIGFL